MTIDKRTAALGVAAAAAVAAAVIVTTVGHHSSGSRQRRAVADYIARVNAIQNQMHVPLTRVLFAYRDFSSHRSRRTSGAELASAATTLTTLAHRLAALPAPPEARKLRRLLLRLVGRQAEITQEVRGLAMFAPRYTEVLAAARAASLELGAKLRAIVLPTPRALRGTKQAVAKAKREYNASASAAATAQADAVDAYDRSVNDVVRRLSKLDPPPAFAASYSAQLGALSNAVAAGGRLSVELRKSNRARVPTLSRTFALASREAQTLAAQRAAIADIRAYNTRARAIRDAALDVQSELARLQRTLP